MLVQARINLTEIGLDMPLFQLDFRGLPTHFTQSFDAVVCLAAIGFMTSEVDFLRAFESMGQVLRSGGILILTAVPTDRQWKEQPRFILTTNTPDFSRLFAIDYMEDKARFNILDIFHTDGGSDLQVWSVELHPLLMDDQERLLKVAGFQKVEFYGGFDFSAYDKEASNSLIAVTHK
jgi:SAM-dependent methyltransferase